MPPKAKKQALPDDCMPKCKTCKFWEFQKDLEAGLCHRLPPVVFMVEEDPATLFPVTDDKDWCGEFQRQTS